MEFSLDINNLFTFENLFVLYTMPFQVGSSKSAYFNPEKCNTFFCPKVENKNRNGMEIMSDDFFVLYGRRYTGGNADGNNRVLKRLRRQS